LTVPNVVKALSHRDNSKPIVLRIAAPSQQVLCAQSIFRSHLPDLAMVAWRIIKTTITALASVEDSSIECHELLLSERGFVDTESLLAALEKIGTYDGDTEFGLIEFCYIGDFETLLEPGLHSLQLGWRITCPIPWHESRESAICGRYEDMTFEGLEWLDEVPKIAGRDF